MEQSIVVRYTVKPEAIEEHVRLIQGVFEQLHREHPAGVVGYQVLRLNDGETFVHVSTPRHARRIQPAARVVGVQGVRSRQRFAGQHDPESNTCHDHRVVPRRSTLQLSRHADARFTRHIDARRRSHD